MYPYSGPSVDIEQSDIPASTSCRAPIKYVSPRSSVLFPQEKFLLEFQASSGGEGRETARLHCWSCKKQGLHQANVDVGKSASLNLGGFFFASFFCRSENKGLTKRSRRTCPGYFLLRGFKHPKPTYSVRNTEYVRTCFNLLLVTNLSALNYLDMYPQTAVAWSPFTA